MVLEPWEHVVESACEFAGAKEMTVRIWGRERLLTLAPLLPLARTVDVYLAGFGLPSIYVLDLGGVSFTLALSGWTDNDWTGGARFDLLTRRLASKGTNLLAVYEELRRQRASTDTALAATCGLGVERARSALSHLCQIGRAMFDLSTGTYRHRDLFFEPFTAKQAEAAVAPAASEKTAAAREGREILDTDNVRVIARRPVSTGYKISGSAKGRDGARVRPMISVDHEGQIVQAQCTCSFFHKHALTKGPCEHMLALRLAHMTRLAAEDVKGGDT
jgi:predicted nucleic acid-binding Zn finger protein